MVYRTRIKYAAVQMADIRGRWLISNELPRSDDCDHIGISNTWSAGKVTSTSKFTAGIHLSNRMQTYIHS